MTAPIEDNELRQQATEYLNKIFKTSPFLYSGNDALADLLGLITRRETEARLDEIHDLALGLNQNILQDPVYRRRVAELEQKLKNTASTP